MNRKLILAFTFSSLAVSAAAQTTGGYSLDFELSKHDFADTVQIDYRRHQVLVPVEIGGRTYRFLLDTGAGHAVVYSDQLFDGCTVTGNIVSRDAVGHTDTVQVLTMPALTIGTLTLTGCQATLQQRAVSRSDIDGILGFDLVCKGLQMKIDVRRRQLILSDRKKFFDGEQGHALRYRLDYHVPYIKIAPFEGYTERVLFDTGSRRLYSMNKASFDRCEASCRSRVAAQTEGRSVGRHAIGLSGTEPLGEVVFLALDSLALGGFSFGDLHTLTTQGGSHVGAPLLDYGTVTFIPRRRRMVFSPYDGVSRVLVGNEQLQKAIVNEEDLPVVGLVWERSEAYHAGLRQGDIILKADDTPIPSFTDYLGFHPLLGRVYRVTVRDRRGFMKEVMMKW